MKNPANSNIYEVNALSVLEAFAGYVEGDPEDLLMVIATESQSNEVRSALSNTAARLNYGQFITWVNINGDDVSLGPQELMTVVEGIDPLAIVALDAASITLLEETYRCALVPDAYSHVFGRRVVTFTNFATLLTNEDDKRRAWGLLKKLAYLSK